MKFYTIAQFSVLILLVGPSYSQSRPILTGKIEGLEEGQKVWLIGDHKDSTTVKNGVFVFYNHGLEPGLYNLRLSREYKSLQWKDIYIDNSSLVLSAKDSHFSGFKLSGAVWTRDFTDYEAYIQSHGYINESLSVSALIATAAEKKEKELDAAAYKAYLLLDSAITSWQFDWVRNHRSSLVSSFVLYSQLQYKFKSPDELDVFLVKLTSKDNLFYKTLAESVAAYRATAIGKAAPNFSLKASSGEVFSLESTRGSYVLVDFWASWCVPCREQNPFLLTAYQKFKEKGFSIISVSLDDKPELWLEAIKEDNLPWLQLSDLKGWKSSAGRMYHITSIPMNFLISPGGMIVAKNLRGNKLEQTLNGLLTN